LLLYSCRICFEHTSHQSCICHRIICRFSSSSSFSSDQTELAKALAGEAGAAFLAVGPSDVLSKYVGESEASIRNLFLKAASMAREMDSKCAVLFFDEIDALGQSRGGVGSGVSPGGSTGTSLDAHTGTGGGNEGSSRRILAELLIQMTRLNSANGLTIDDMVLTTEDDDDDDDDEEADRRKELEENVDDENDHQNVQDRLIDDDDCSVGSMDNKSGFSATNEARSHTAPLESSKKNVPVRVIVVAATNRPEDCDPA
jgi:SpoVK/Ycf46/Vps4 family AAA+-type ATPase